MRHATYPRFLRFRPHRRAFLDDSVVSYLLAVDIPGLFTFDLR
jgi:hypothetical protein